VKAVGIYANAWDKHTFDIQVFKNNAHDILDSDGIALASEMGGLREEIRMYNNVSWNNRFVGIAITTNGDSPNHPMKDIAIVNNTVFENGAGEWGEELTWTIPACSPPSSGTTSAAGTEASR
jgi:hypothetical protein